MESATTKTLADQLLREAVAAAASDQWEVALARAETALHLGSVDHRGPALRLRALDALSRAALTGKRAPSQQRFGATLGETPPQPPAGLRHPSGDAVSTPTAARPYPRGTTEEIAGKAETLLSVPSFVSRIMSAIDDETTSMPELARWLSNDPAITAATLRVANSANYHRARRIETVREAVVLLGAKEVRRLVITSALMKSSGAVRVVRYPEFWRFSLTVSFLAELQALISGVGRDVAYTAGVVQDIGLLALDLVDPDGLRTVLELELGPGMRRRADREAAVYGFSSELVGAELARRWGFPDSLIGVIAARHSRLDEVSGMDPVIEYVIRARRFARSFGLSDGVEQNEPKPPPEEWTRPPLSDAVERVGGLEAVVERIDYLIAA